MLVIAAWLVSPISGTRRRLEPSRNSAVARAGRLATGNLSSSRCRAFGEQAPPARVDGIGMTAEMFTAPAHVFQPVGGGDCDQCVGSVLEPMQIVFHCCHDLKNPGCL